MTTAVEESGKLDPSLLSRQNYVLSLLSCASAAGRLKEDELARFQIGCVERVAELAATYTGGESSSVRSEVAEELMASLLYTIGLSIQEEKTPEAALSRLLHTEVRALAASGTEKIKGKLFAIRKLGDFLSEHHAKTQSVYYRQAVTRLYHNFFRRYAPKFFAHDVAVLPDYPLLVPVTDLLGVEYMQKYMESLYYETRFLLLFPKEIREDTFRYMAPDYQNAPVNLLAPVLLSALTCQATERDPALLHTGIRENATLKLFREKSREETESILQEALSGVIAVYHMQNPHMAAYLKKAASRLADEVFEAFSHRIPENVFPLFRREETNTAVFRFGKRMDDDLFSGIYYQIENAESFEEQCRIIREKIHSLYDFEDVVRGILFTENELFTLFSPLKATELAFLLKRNPLPEDLQTVKDPVERRFSDALLRVLQDRSPKEQTEIQNMVLTISDDIFER